MELNLPDLDRPDHRQHAVAGMAVGGLSLALIDAFDLNSPLPVRIIVPIAAATLVGLVKEVRDDAGHGHAESGDLLATAAGGAVLSVAWSVRF